MNPNKKLAFSIDDILCEKRIKPNLSSPPQSPLEPVDMKYAYSKFTFNRYYQLDTIK